MGGREPRRCCRITPRGRDAAVPHAGRESGPNRAVELVFRRGFFTLILLALLAGLLNVFGQRPTTSHAATSVADLEVFAPEDLRGGLYYEGRITVDAKEDIDKVTLVFDGGWTEQMQINTVEPAPSANRAETVASRSTTATSAPATSSSSISSSRSTRPTSAAARRTSSSTTTPSSWPRSIEP